MVFPRRDLLTSALTTTVGTGYLFPLAWGKDQPRADKITVVARYLPPQGPAVSFRSQLHLDCPAALSAALSAPAQEVKRASTDRAPADTGPPTQPSLRDG